MPAYLRKAGFSVYLQKYNENSAQNILQFQNSHKKLILFCTSSIEAEKRQKKARLQNRDINCAPSLPGRILDNWYPARKQGRQIPLLGY
ncbi:hypothetical protein LJC48_07190 [Desulfovibrio sp. OttesenSCG-928-C06]|nr:hypothetical protein [Desulfovibrio sp. OttesenSCG-928-C06]